jgi:NAD(P)-dependent dehydrogenase (short-subunit alcohol dehydrogenase family)
MGPRDGRQRARHVAVQQSRCAGIQATAQRVIINISSGTIFGGQTGFAHYVTSKAAVWGLARVLARELGEFGVRVNRSPPA